MDSERVLVLQEASSLTSGDRDKTYGPPFINQRLAGELKLAFRKYMTREIGPAELEAVDMILTKLSRIGSGQPKPHRDNYVDGAAYFGIAYENALEEWSIRYSMDAAAEKEIEEAWANPSLDDVMYKDQPVDLSHVGSNAVPTIKELEERQLRINPISLGVDEGE